MLRKEHQRHVLSGILNAEVGLRFAFSSYLLPKSFQRVKDRVKVNLSVL